MAEARVSPVLTDNSESKDNSVLPYQFEPVRDDGAMSDDSWDTVEEDSDVEYQLVAERNHQDAEDWCTCGSCQRMQTSVECLCCKEITETKTMLNRENIGIDIDYIVNHEGFNPVCLDKNVLWTALVNLADREGCVIPPKDNVPNRTYRYASYRQFTWWIHDRLGRHVRRVIPSCAISRIRAEFEEDDGNYSVFEGDDEVASEITKTMAWHDLHQDE